MRFRWKAQLPSLFVVSVLMWRVSPLRWVLVGLPLNGTRMVSPPPVERFQTVAVRLVEVSMWRPSEVIEMSWTCPSWWAGENRRTASSGSKMFTVPSLAQVASSWLSGEMVTRVEERVSG